jgi:hypothetical protein
VEERRGRISILSRRSRGKVLQPSFLAGLSDALGVPVSPEQLFDLAETDTVRRVLSEGYRVVLENRQPSFRKFFSKAQESNLLYLVDCLSNRIGTNKVVLHIKESELCGAIASKASTVLERSKEIIRLDGDSLNILSTDYQNGLILNFNPDELDEHYELAVWGDRWPLAII